MSSAKQMKSDRQSRNADLLFTMYLPFRYNTVTRDIGSFSRQRCAQQSGKIAQHGRES